MDFSDQGWVESLTWKCSEHGHCDLCTPEAISEKTQTAHAQLNDRP